MERLLLDHWWLGAAVFAVAYSADYYLTVYGAMLRARWDPQSDARYSYELTPQFQKDIDARRLLSRRFVRWLVLGVLRHVPSASAQRNRVMLRTCRRMIGTSTSSSAPAAIR